MPQSRIKPEYTKLLSNGTLLYINQIGDINGEKCFLITDPTGKYGSFVIDADGDPLAGERLTSLQKLAVIQIMKTIQQILGT
jgi:hypothetical protein